MNKKPIEYMQTDPRWKSLPYQVPGETSTIGGFSDDFAFQGLAVEGTNLGIGERHMLVLLLVLRCPKRGRGQIYQRLYQHFSDMSKAQQILRCTSVD